MVKHEVVALRAYKKWQEAGSPEGDGKEFWYAAENELLTEVSKAKKTSVKQQQEKPNLPPPVPHQSKRNDGISWMEKIRRLWSGKTNNP